MVDSEGVCGRWIVLDPLKIVRFCLVRGLLYWLSRVVLVFERGSARLEGLACWDLIFEPVPQNHRG